MRVVVAGTFGPIHDGHRALLKTALERGEDGVVVGLTTDAFARSSRTREVPPFEERKRALADEIESLDEWEREVEVRAIDDEDDFAAEDPTLDAIVVSEETDEDAADLNRRREANGLDPLAVIEIPMVTAEDGERISSTRVVRGEIDEHGRTGE